MRIDLLITELDMGGAEKCLVDIACHLRRRNHQVRVIALGNPPPTDRDVLLERLKQVDLEPIFFRANHATDLLRVRRRLNDLVRAAKPQVSMSFLFHANWLASLVYPRHSVPWIAGVRVADRSRWRALLSRRAYRSAARVVCVSQSVADHVVQFERAKPDRVDVISNGVDLEKTRINPSEEAIAALLSEWNVRTPFVLFVGRYVPQKRVAWVLRLASDERLKQSNWQVVMMGDGPQKSAIHTLADSYPEKIIDIGRHRDVVAWMNASELLLLPSAYEGMPNVVLEAMACRKPVAATAVHGITELLGNHASAQSTDPDNCDAWLDLVFDLMSSDSKRRLLGEYNYQRCKSAFSLSDKLAAYEQLLTSFVGARS